MSKTIIIFGAGKAWSYQIAKKHAQQGYQVALVSRTKSRLDDLAFKLQGEVPGTKVSVFVADLSIIDQVISVSSAIKKQYGSVDVIYSGLAPHNIAVMPSAAQLTVDSAKTYVDMYYYSAVEIVQQFLPIFLQQKSGAFLFGGGGLAVNVMPGLCGPGPAQAALHQFALTLNKELIDKNIYVGIVLVAAGIGGSETYEHYERMGVAGMFPQVDPAKLGELVWEMIHVTKEAEKIVVE